MSVVRLASWMLLVSFPLACGERAGDAVVALPTANDLPAGDEAGRSGGDGAGGTDEQTSGSASGGATGNSSGGPSGLCAPCDSSRECGDANDACLVHEGARFCGRDCDEQRDCPDGYSCLELSNSQLWQCVPDTACLAPEPPSPTLEDVRSYVLDRINGERFAQARQPLQSSTCLDELAQQSAVDFARTDEPLGKYVKECDPVWPSCACGWWAEAEVTVARYGLDWETAIDRALSASRDSGNQRFSNAYLSTLVSDIGIGFWLSGDEAWVALSFR